MAQRPNVDDLMRLWKLSVMPTEKVYFAQSYVDRKAGADGKLSAIVQIAPTTGSGMPNLDLRHR